jgi:hypothetical protein
MTDRLPIAGSAVGFSLKNQPQDGGGAQAIAAGAGALLPWAAVAVQRERADP